MATRDRAARRRNIPALVDGCALAVGEIVGEVLVWLVRLVLAAVTR